MRSRIFFLAALLACGTELAHVTNASVIRFRAARLNLAFGTLAALSATPGTISFQAANPDAGQVSGSSPGSLTWNVSSGSRLQHWTLSVQSGTSSFLGCPTVPASAVQVSCGSASAPAGAGGTAVCGGSFPLSTSPQQIAGGAEGDGTGSYSVWVNFALAESWRYVANSACSINLSYTISAP